MGESVKAHDRQLLAAYIGKPRLAPYLREASNDEALAIRMYEWNAELTTALWLPLCHLEVAVRNAFSVALQFRYRAELGSGLWIDRPAAILRRRESDEVESAKQRVEAKKKSVTVGQVISELNLGFWRFLVGKRYVTTLWPYLANAFQHAPSRNQSDIAKRMVRLHKTRNRLAHHEPIWNHEPLATYQDIITLAGYMSPVLHDWIKQLSEVEDVWARDPRGAHL